MSSLAGFHLWPCSCLAPLLLAFLRPSFEGSLGLDMIPDSRGPAMGQVTEVSSFSAAEEIPSDLNHKKEQCWPPTRQSLWIFCVALLVLGVTAAVMGLGITFGMPIKPANMPHQQCKTAPQQFGFLCEDLTTCLPPSLLCDGKLDCSHGEDESATYCGQLPSSLPQNLIFKCPNQKTWTYVDKVCDTRNDCGDCSDESVLQCLECSGWSCDTVSFADCACIPRTRCKNGIQDCADWSDENLCE